MTALNVSTGIAGHVRALGAGGYGLHGLDQPGGRPVVGPHGLGHEGHGRLHAMCVLHEAAGGGFHGGLGGLGAGYAKDGGQSFQERHAAFSGKKVRGPARGKGLHGQVGDIGQGHGLDGLDDAARLVIVVDRGNVAVFAGGDVRPALLRPLDPAPHSIGACFKLRDPPRSRGRLSVRGGKFDLMVVVHGDIEAAVVLARAGNDGLRLADVGPAPVPARKRPGGKDLYPFRRGPAPCGQGRGMERFEKM